MTSVGGISYKNGIEFQAKHYSVKFETYPDKTKMFLRKNESKTSKILGFMFRIPLLRGIALLIKTKLVFLFFLFEFIFNMIKIEAEEPLWMKIILWICNIGMWYYLIMGKNAKSKYQYHGAEHKVIFTNEQKLPITLKNCRKASRTHDNCGTMLAVLLIFTFFITNIIISFLGITGGFFIPFLIAWITACEFFEMDRDTPVIHWLFKLGYWFQKNIFTREPSDFQLNQAIEAFKLLEKVETGKIPGEELQQLLQDSKQGFNKLF